ncbi:hypothetical protein N3K66_004200 [Trichothecium roseum]|uniref:Uncharacterized protein n=1 Tax=Trichothecium roseum TaxID=47278 RepID=A0ACC0V298_9HYPO|nr:hypothetical protein N3K66_004200 [Trichothecium roseum]
MHTSSALVLLLAAAFDTASAAAATTAISPSADKCHYAPSVNATRENNPSANPGPFPYDLDRLSSVPVADICNTPATNATSSISTSTSNGQEEDQELACARKYIDAIDEQLAFLYARRLGFAAVAGHAKRRQGVPLNDPGRNGVVAEGMAGRVAGYGGSADAGRVMGGEGCQIYASLGFEVGSIREGGCEPGFEEDFERVCT